MRNDESPDRQEKNAPVQWREALLILLFLGLVAVSGASLQRLFAPFFG